LVQADIVAGQVTNQATVVGTQPDGTSVTDFSDDNSVLENDPTLTILCPNSMSLIKNQTSPAGGLGDTLTYDIVVTNTGTTILTDIEITDANAVITGGNPIASLLPGASATVTAVHEITQGDIDLGYIENIAMGLGDSPDGTDDVSDDSDAGTDVNGDPILDPEGTETPDGDGTTNGDPTDDPTVTVIEQASSMSLIKNQTSPAGGLGDTLTYDIVVTNTGTTILTDIEITDANAVITGGNPIASLLPGASATVTAAHEITQDDIDLGYVENIAIGLGDSPDGTDDVGDDSDAGTDVNGDPILDPEGTETPDGDGTTNGDPTDDPTVTVIGQIGQNTSSMSLIKNQTSSAGGLGDTLTYDIVVTNTGTTILTDIEITDANAVITGGNPIASLLPGESVTITAAHEITQDDIDLGYVENIAIGLGDSPDGTDDVGDDSDAGTDVNGDPILDPEGTETPDGDGTTNGDPTDDPTVTVIGQDPSSMSLIKNQTSSAGGLGDTLTYDIVVTNTGTTILTDIVITDANAVITGGNPIASLLPGESVTITAAHEITQDDIDLGYVENIAIGLGDSPDGTDDVGDDSDAGTDVNGDPILDPEGTETPDGDGTTNGDPTDDPTITVIEQASSMSLIKNQTSQEVELGDTLTYEIVVTNTGNTTLTDIEITDANAVITGGFVNPIESLMPGASVTITAEHEITQGDIDLTYVENIAMGLGDSPNGTDDVGDDSDAGTDINGNPILDSETVETPNGDGSTNQDPTDDPTITGLSGIEGAQLIIYNVVTPNNDGAHDYFQVLGIQEWPNNNMKIYNRWGVLVFETDGYGGSDGKENVFTGISDGRVTVKETDELPTGTYFYVLTLLENELESPEGKNNYSGYLYINR
ncbi:MAG: gliding motility-associated-like protein, partial [Saprospiraceae bacterium]